MRAIKDKIADAQKAYDEARKTLILGHKLRIEEMEKNLQVSKVALLEKHVGQILEKII